MRIWRRSWRIWQASEVPHGKMDHMAEDAAELLAHALKLPAEARAALADSLIESLDTEIDEDAEESWRREIELRLQDLDSNAVQPVSWEQVRRQLRERFPR